LAGISTESMLSIGRIVLASMTFWATGDLASMALKFHSVARGAEGVVSRTTALLAETSESNLRDGALLAFGDYNSILASAPPIPNLRLAT